MIHRQNWLDVRAYLKYTGRIRQNCPETVKRTRGHLRHLLEWADATPFPKARTVDPTFPAYLVDARGDGREEPLAPASIVKGLAVARQFFTFARMEWPLRYKLISPSWIAYLQAPRQSRLNSRLTTHQFYTLADVRRIAAVSTETLRQERGRVAVCMLFLSGMRADALASLPVSCVDLAAGQIMQLPEAGVRTKNRKAAITYLLPIPDLLEVCRGWDRRVRAGSPDALWYSPVASDGMSFLPRTRAVLGRGSSIEHDVRLVCGLAGVPYLSPHKLRHGHVVHALKQARNMAELKAISQNVMHASVTITDQIYGGLTNDDVRQIIGGLGAPRENKTTALEERLSELLDRLEQKVS